MRKNVANYALLGCKTFSLKIWLWKILDKYHVWSQNHLKSTRNYYWDQMESISSSWLDWLGHKAVTRWGKLFFLKWLVYMGILGAWCLSGSFVALFCPRLNGQFLVECIYIGSNCHFQKVVSGWRNQDKVGWQWHSCQTAKCFRF